jgi:hypothetical protein
VGFNGAVYLCRRKYTSTTWDFQREESSSKLGSSGVLDKWFFANATKAKGEYRLLTCDGQDSHINGSFIGHCLQNRTTLLILPPHTSHLLQPLDVAIFGPLKKPLTAALAHPNQAQLIRIQKVEWMDAYIQARSETCIPNNVGSSWRGAGLFPLHSQRALRTMALAATPEAERPQTPTEFNIFNRVFINSK